MHSRDDLRAYTAHAAVVTDNADPLKLGRVKASIPGYIKETGWAYPLGTSGGGEAGLGTYSVPAVGAEVSVSFADGDVNSPRYISGHWGLTQGLSDIPRAALAALDESGADQASLIYACETPRFEVVHDSRANKSRFYIRAKQKGENMNGNAIMIELDETNGTIGISAPAGITIRSHGAIALEANQITLNGRVVAPSNKAI